MQDEAHSPSHCHRYRPVINRTWWRSTYRYNCCEDSTARAFDEPRWPCSHRRFSIGYKTFYSTIPSIIWTVCPRVKWMYLHDVCVTYHRIVHYYVHDIHQDNVFIKTFKASSTNWCNHHQSFMIFHVSFNLFDHLQHRQSMNHDFQDVLNSRPQNDFTFNWRKIKKRIQSQRLIFIRFLCSFLSTLLCCHIQLKEREFMVTLHFCFQFSLS